MEFFMTDPIPYTPKDVEAKWQAKWEADGLYRSDIDPSRPKHYALTMLPYPSGDLHIGHWYAITPSDAHARYMRMRGYNVLFPMGFDSFGLPAENAAIKRKIHPKTWTYANIERMRVQLKSMGAMFDWRREAVTSDPEFYRWTQWFFAQLFENGLAYRKYSPVDWCPNCNTTLAREQVWGDDRHCERCGTLVVKKNLEQWYFRITNYADELLQFDGIDWPERVRTLQTNWIGRSEGASVTFHTEAGDPLTVFTTRPDTLWGATFMVLAPEHPLVAALTTPAQRAEVEAYIDEAVRQTDIQRESSDKDKSGVFTGGYAINPVNEERIPIWIADYVLMTYGTGAIMAVPAHDERDFEFALKFGLPIIPVIARPDGLTKSFVPPHAVGADFAAALAASGLTFATHADGLAITLQPEQVAAYTALVQAHLQPGRYVELVGGTWKFIYDDVVFDWDSQTNEQRILARCKALDVQARPARTLMELLWSRPFYRDVLLHHEYGDLIHSGAFSGTPGATAKAQVIAWLTERGLGERAVNYRMRDWLISRQRYWGAPIPIVYCPEHGAVSVPDDQLPVLLPDDVAWLPTGESPLKLHPTWSHTTCPICGGPAERDTDTMDTFMCSSWYHLRYLSPHYDKYPFDPSEYAYWMPVDTYTGGIEHATMHLLYTRFFHKACRDLGITQGDEPMIQLRNQGIILGEDAEKMSKSRGNVVAPDLLVNRYGADTVRAYLMFFARWELGAPWNSSGIEGAARWVRRVWTMVTEPGPQGNPSPEARRALRRAVHQTLRQVTYDFEHFEFNTIVSGLMGLLNDLYHAREGGASGTPEWREALDLYVRMMAPITPHIAEELWAFMGKPYSVHTQPWPEVDEAAAVDEQITLVVQVNGKVRDRITLAADVSEEDAKAAALASELAQKFMEGKPPRKVVLVPGKLVNIVV
jgi:leucyl-tRNA synthetase